MTDACGSCDESTIKDHKTALIDTYFSPVVVPCHHKDHIILNALGNISISSSGLGLECKASKIKKPLFAALIMNQDDLQNVPTGPFIICDNV